MCGRFVQVIDIELFIKRFGVREPAQITLKDNFNVSAGDLAYVITNDKPGELQEFRFGLTPHWAKKQMYLINARSEGDNNPGDEPSYSGKMGIIDKPSFRIPVRSKRCLIIANGFYEGPAKEKLNKPYFISKKNLELFTFAGIWDTWIYKETSEVINSFSIITTVSNSVTRQVGHHRSPVILDRKDEAAWLNDNHPLDEVLKLLKPCEGDEFSAVAVSIKVKDPKNKGRELIIPVESGSSIEFDSVIKKDLRLEGMGRNKRE
jgi:putative SOS response-associated peptidase YedK